MKNAFSKIATVLVCAIAPLSFANDDPIHAVFLLHEVEYDTAITVPEFAKKELEEKLGWKCTFLFGDGPNSIPGTEILEDADLMFISVRRQILPQSQLNNIKAYCESGKPVVGIRTASHAFAARRRSPNAKGVEWPEFDQEILGGNYHGHYAKDPDGPRCYIWSQPEDKTHTILTGVTLAKRLTTSWLYQVQPLADTATPIVFGQDGDNPVEPVAWTNIGKHGNRVFYTSLGHQDEFKSKDFRRLLKNGILWAITKP